VHVAVTDTALGQVRKLAEKARQVAADELKRRSNNTFGGGDQGRGESRGRTGGSLAGGRGATGGSEGGGGGRKMTAGDDD
jgi:hypothetical protein